MGPTQHWPPLCFDKSLMKSAVQLCERVCRRVHAFKRTLEFLQDCADICDVLLAPGLCCKEPCFLFVHLAKVEDVLNFGTPDGSDNITAARPNHHQALDLKPPQCLAYGHAADSKQLGRAHV